MPLFPFAVTPLRAALLLASVTVSVPAAAQSRFPIDLPAQALGSSLHGLAEQTNTPIVFRTALTAGKQAPAVKGEYGVEEALRKLLVGSGLVPMQSADHAFTLVSADAAPAVTSLQQVRVVGTGEAKANSVNPNTSVGSKIALEQREIAQTVSVISQAQIESQKLTNVQEALRYTPGVSTPNVDSSRYRIYSRGFQIDNIQIDGVSTPIVGYMTPANLAMYDRIEVLKGPAGLLGGPGGAGGAVNLVRKRPTREVAGSAQFGIGNYGTLREQVDMGGPLNDAGTLRARGVLAVNNNDLRQDGTHRSDVQAYGILEADLSPNTTAAFGVSYQRTNSKSMQYGYPTYKDGSFLDVDLSTYYGPDWNHEKYTLSTVFGEIEHRLDNGWKTKLSANYLSTYRYSEFGGLRGAVDPATNTSSYQTSMSGADSDQVVVDAYGAGPFTLLGRRHMATIGASYNHERNPQIGAPGVPRNIPVDLSNPGYVPTATFNALSRQNTRTEQLGLYANTRFSLADPLTLVLGARATWWKARVTVDPTANANNSTDTADKISGHITPVAGLIYDLDDRHSVYASYTQIFAPQAVRDSSGSLLKPLEGSQYETGVKGSYLGGKVDASLAVFQITQENRAILDTTNNAIATYFAQGKARSRGIEAQVSGEIMPGWTASGGYTLTATKYLDGSADIGKNAFSTYTPKHLLKLWTQYLVPGMSNKLTLNAGLYTSSGIRTDDGVTPIRQGAYTTMDIGATYAFTPKLSASLTVNNVFDRRYYQTISTTQDHNFLGDSRMALLTLRAQY